MKNRMVEVKSISRNDVEGEVAILLHTKSITTTFDGWRRATRAKPPTGWKKLEIDAMGKCTDKFFALRRSFPELSRSELRIGVLLIDWLSSGEIATILGLSERTVENARSNIRKKLEVPRGVSLCHIFSKPSGR